MGRTRKAERRATEITQKAALALQWWEQSNAIGQAVVSRVMGKKTIRERIFFATGIRLGKLEIIDLYHQWLVRCELGGANGAESVADLSQLSTRTGLSLVETEKAFKAIYEPKVAEPKKPLLRRLNTEQKERE